jgi:hypothetical protein
LWWDVVADPSPQQPPTNPAPEPYPPSACVLANESPPQYGAPVEWFADFVTKHVARDAQYMEKSGDTGWGVIKDGIYNPALISWSTFRVVESQVDKANATRSELWLSGAAPCINMSYYIPLPNLEREGLVVVWEGLGWTAPRHRVPELGL